MLSISVSWIGIYDIITIGTIIYQISSNYKSVLNFLNLIDFDQKVEIYTLHKKSHPNHTLIIFETYIKYKQINKILTKKLKSLLKILKQTNLLLERASVDYCIYIKKIETRINQLINDQVIYILDVIGIKKYFEEYIHNHQIFSKINTEFTSRGYLNITNVCTNNENNNDVIQDDHDVVNNNTITDDKPTINNVQLYDYDTRQSVISDIRRNNNLCENLSYKSQKVNFPPGLIHPLNKSCPLLDQHTQSNNDGNDFIGELQEEVEKDFKQELQSEFKDFDYNNV